ncbi:MAG: hypothetical protein R6U98_15175 [Pirellulaceae bacterium]
MESCPTQAVLPLVGLAAEKIIRDRSRAYGSVHGRCRCPNHDCYPCDASMQAGYAKGPGPGGPRLG